MYAVQTSSTDFKLSIPCISNQCIPVLYRPNAPHHVYINSKYTILTCYDNNIGTLYSLMMVFIYPNML